MWDAKIMNKKMDKTTTDKHHGNKVKPSSSDIPADAYQTITGKVESDADDMSTEFVKEYEKLVKEGKEINPEEIKLQNVVRETMFNPKTLHATRTQIGRATGIGYSLLGAGVVLGLLGSYFFKKKPQASDHTK